MKVRLWVDRIDQFARMCPSISVDSAKQNVGLIEVRRWDVDFPAVDVADVVIEAFACELPSTYVAAMVGREVAPVWINLEYLSAETWVEECHGLPSQQSRCSLTKYFFFPGFTAKTGGLIHERNLFGAKAAFEQNAASDFWSELGIPSNRPSPHQPRSPGFEIAIKGLSESGEIEGNSQRIAATEFIDATEICDVFENDSELRISLFCYENPALLQLLNLWSDGQHPIRLLTSPGAPTDQVSRWLGMSIEPGIPVRRGALTVQPLPFLSQFHYDRLLWACDINFVRGEDSFVRAQWAQRPFVWQIYPQAEKAHLVKLDAFLDRFLRDFDDSEPVKRCFRAWNGVGDIAIAWQEYLTIRLSLQRHGKVWASELDHAGNLADNLVRFVNEKNSV